MWLAFEEYLPRSGVASFFWWGLPPPAVPRQLMSSFKIHRRILLIDDEPWISEYHFVQPGMGTGMETLTRTTNMEIGAWNFAKLLHGA